jgi:hypothetical protein
MKVQIALTLLIIHFSCAVFSQSKDTLLLKVTKAKSEETRNSLYNVIAYNASTRPICILHSSFINLFDGDAQAQRLALFNKNESSELYSLIYVAKDTLIDYEGPNDNYNGEIILPHQYIEFSLLIPSGSDKKKYLQFDYLYLTDLCYNSFEKEIFKDATHWHRKYTKYKKMVELAE